MKIQVSSLEDLPSSKENMLSLFQSVVKEQASVSKFILLEAEKINTFAGDMDFPFAESPEDILKFVQSTKRICDLITLKGLLLIQKNQDILLIGEKFSKGEEGKET